MEDENFSSGMYTYEDSYRFTGSNKDWDVSYEVVITDGEAGKNQVKEIGTALFIGEGSVPEQVSYNFTTETGKHYFEEKDLSVSNEQINFAQRSCMDCVPIKIDENLILEIKWDDQSEEISWQINSFS